MLTPISAARRGKGFVIEDLDERTLLIQPGNEAYLSEQLEVRHPPLFPPLKLPRPPRLYLCPFPTASSRLAASRGDDG